MYRKNAVKRHGGFDEDMKAFTDSGLRLRIALNGGLVVRTEGGFAIYRPVENSITKNSLKIHFHAIKLVKKLLASEYAVDSKKKITHWPKTYRSSLTILEFMAKTSFLTEAPSSSKVHCTPCKSHDCR